VRDFTKVPPAIWQDKRFAALGDCERLLYLYLLSSPHQNSCGCCYLPASYASADLNWPRAKFDKSRGKLQDAGLIHHDPNTDEIAITDWFAMNAPNNQSHRRGLEKMIEAIKSERLREMVNAALDQAAPEVPIKTLEQVRNRYRQPSMVMPIQGGKR
jgi:hypothetical protein